MPFIKRYDTLACEILIDAEIVNTESGKKVDNEIKQNEKNKRDDIKANELANLIMFT